MPLSVASSRALGSAAGARCPPDDETAAGRRRIEKNKLRRPLRMRLLQLPIWADYIYFGSFAATAGAQERSQAGFYAESDFVSYGFSHTSNQHGGLIPPA